MAEWLRRVIRNHLGSSRVGSNPARSVLFFARFPGICIGNENRPLLPSLSTARIARDSSIGLGSSEQNRLINDLFGKCRSPVNVNLTYLATLAIFEG